MVAKTTATSHKKPAKFAIAQTLMRLSSRAGMSLLASNAPSDATCVLSVAHHTTTL